MTIQERALIDIYNTKDNFLIISEYPERNKKSGKTALSWFSFNTVISLSPNQSSSHRGVVIADIIDTEEIYEDNGVLFIRCFRRNDIASFAKVIYYCRLLNQITSVMFEFEFASYGSQKIILIIPFLLLNLRLNGKKIIFVLHQVVPSIDILKEHLGITGKWFIIFIVKLAISLFYRVIGLLSTNVIVLEHIFKERLSHYVSDQKIIVIPIGIDVTVLNNQVQKNTNDFTILVFGYIVWYKGIDDIIRAFAQLPQQIEGKNVKLIIAGGKGIAQTGKKHYDDYYRNIEVMASSDTRITLTGYVPDAEIAQYFQKADLVVLPYKEFISSSGPFSLAMAYERPVLLSLHLGEYEKTKDFTEAVKVSGIQKSTLFSSINSESAARLITSLITKDSIQTQYRQFAIELKKRRSWQEVAKKYMNILFQK